MNIYQIHLLFRQGKYNQAIGLINQFQANDSDYYDAQLLKARCIFEQGMIRDAITLLGTLLSSKPPEEHALKYELIGYFMAMYNGDHHKYYQKAQNLGDIILKGETYSPSLKNFTFDMMNRSEAFLSIFGLTSINQKGIIIENMGKVASFHFDNGEVIEGLTAQLRQAIFANSGFLNKELAYQLFNEVKLKAHKISDALLEAEAGLYVAIMDVENNLRDGVKITPDSFRVFENVANLFEQGGSEIGTAIVYQQLGETLLKYGFKQGEDLVKESLRIFSETKQYSRERAASQKLHTWYTKRGDHEKAKEIQLISQEVAKKLQIAMYHNLNDLAEADALFRGGRLGESQESLERDKNVSNNKFSAANIIIQANELSSNGREQEAEKLLLDLIQNLNETGTSPLLSQAQFVLSNTVLFTKPDESIYWLDQAIKTDQVLKDRLSEAYHLYNKGWTEAQRQRLQTGTIQITEDVLANFQEAEQILLEENSLDAKEMLGSLYQMLGQIYAFTKDYTSCAKWIEKAEDIFYSIEYKPNLAFLASYKGLILTEIARMGSLTTYDEAYKLFIQSEKYFEEIGVLSEIWRPIHFQGITQQEASRGETEVTQKEDRLKKAASSFTRATNMIDKLRGYSGSGSAISQQLSAVGFMTKTASVYLSAFNLRVFEMNDPVGAILWLEKMKSRSFLDALANNISPPPFLLNNTLIQKEKTLREKKNQAFSAREALKVQEEINQLLEQMLLDDVTKDYAVLRKGEPTGWDRFKQTLIREESRLNNQSLLVLQYFCRARYTFVYGMRSDWEEPKLQRIHLDYNAFKKLLDKSFHLSGGVRSIKRGSRLREEHKIYEADWQQHNNLIEPILNWSAPNDLICFIPHGILHDLPLHTLQLEGRYIIERNPVFYSPSLSVLNYSLERSSNNNQLQDTNAYVFGNPTKDLTYAEQEAHYIADLLNSKPLMGDKVTKSKVIEALKQGDIIHIAGHGEYAAEDGLQSGMALSKGQKLSAEEIFGLSSKANLVVLSGCETGVSEQKQGDELFGMTRALLYSGVNTLMVSQWRVADRSTRDLLNSFYQKAYGDNPQPKVIALQEAMGEMIKRGMSFYHWGSFVLIGDWN